MDAFDFQWKILMGMRRVKEQTERTLHPFCERYSITPVQLRILMTLHQEGPLTVSALARSSCMADANNSALCKRLDGQGLVDRRRDEEDERQVLVSLTPQGKTVLGEVSVACEEAFRSLSEKLDPGEMEELMTGLDRLLALLNTGGAEGRPGNEKPKGLNCEKEAAS